MSSEKDIEDIFKSPEGLADALETEIQRYEDCKKLDNNHQIEGTIRILNVIAEAYECTSIKDEYATVDEYVEEHLSKYEELYEPVKPWRVPKKPEELKEPQLFEQQISVISIVYTTIYVGGIAALILFLMGLATLKIFFFVCIPLFFIVVGIFSYAYEKSECEKRAKLNAEILERYKRKLMENEAAYESEMKEYNSEMTEYEKELREYKKNVVEAKHELQEEYELNLPKYTPCADFLKTIKRKRILSNTYFEDAADLAEYIEDGRADTIQDAINVLENDLSQEELLRMQARHNSEMEYQAREQARQAREQARIAEEQMRQQTRIAEEQMRQQKKAQEESLKLQRDQLKMQEEAAKSRQNQCVGCANALCSMRRNPPAVCRQYKPRY